MTNSSTQPRYQLCYDHDCPLCVWYTGYFQHHGYLKQGEAIPFHACSAEQMGMLNPEKMVNEIPLINLQTKEVLYGPDAMLKIISGKYPTAARLANKGCARFLIDALYKLVSYNRKVIVGKTPSIAGKECNPIFHANYRSMFIVIISLVTSFFLVTAMLLLNQDVSFNTFITGYFIAMTGSFLYLNKQQKCIANNRLELLGQLAMLLLFASVGIWISALALYISSNQLIAGLLMVVWHIIIMQPQFLRRLQFVFFRGQLAG